MGGRLIARVGSPRHLAVSIDAITNADAELGGDSSQNAKIEYGISDAGACDLCTADRNQAKGSADD